MINKITTKNYGSLIVEQELTFPKKKKKKKKKSYQTLKKLLIQGLYIQMDNPIEYTKKGNVQRNVLK